MDTAQIIMFAGIAAAIIITQMGRHPVTLRRFLLPMAIAAAVAYRYLQTFPTGGGALTFELILMISGVVLGGVAASLIRIESDGQTGKLILEAGLVYAAVWIVVFGGRLGFAWAATHPWRHQVAQFSIAHALPSAAWTDGFILMAVSMVLARTLVVGGRVLAAGRPAAVPELA
jgi:hypothetical protein